MPSAADLLRSAVAPPGAVLRHARSLTSARRAPSLPHLRQVQRLLGRAPLVLAGLTAVICSLITQHPVVVLALMLGFPALLIAQELVDRQVRELSVEVRDAHASAYTPSTDTAAELAIIAEAQRVASALEPHAAAADTRADARRSLPRGITAVGERPDATGTGTTTAAA